MMAYGVAATLGITGCGAAGAPPPHDDAATSSTSTSSSAPPKRAGSPASVRDRVVLVVSVDGLRPATVRELGPRGAPTLHSLLRRGVGTLNARTVAEETQTLSNHASMLTGRRVRVARGGHGVHDTSDPSGTVHGRAGERVASIFSVVARHQGRSALFSSKSKFALFQRSWPHALSRFECRSGDRALTRLVRRDLRRQRRSLTFVHYSAPDVAGHEHGFGSGRYRRTVAATDRHLGRLVRTVRSSARLRQRTTIIVTSDHGGAEDGHEDAGLRANYSVPFLVWGAGVGRGRDLYRLNPDRRQPGAQQIGYGGRQPVRNADLANLTMDLLGLPAVPGSGLNRPNSLALRAR